jgi:murein DD-endopeptidase MepM/ murein hydrolase activator NlpD
MKPAGGGGGGAGVADPAFSARPTLPQGYQPIQSGGGPAPRPDVGDTIRTLLGSLGGGEIPKASSPGVLIPGTSGGSGGGGGGGSSAPLQSGRGNFAYPLGKRGKVIGVPYQGTHTLGNWQSDNALDIAIPNGTPVYATENGTVTRAGSLGRGGQFAGERVQLEGNRNSFWYGHLSKLSVKLGQRVKKGQLLGYSGSANGVQHLHFAQQHGDPRNYFG